MKKYLLINLIFCLSILIGCKEDSIVAHQNVYNHVEEIMEGKAKKAKIMPFGVFHFAYPGLDTHKTKDDLQIDVLDPQRQDEIQSIIEALEKFKPTKIAVERPTRYQPKLDSLYNSYLSGNMELERNEIYQIGFRLAKKLGHKRLDCVDARPKRLPLSDEDEAILNEEYAEFEKSFEAVWNLRYKSLYDYIDTLQSELPLYKSLYLNNTEKLLDYFHGHYFVSAFRSNKIDYSEADGFTTTWFNRNLRIFNNLLNLKESNEERILLIIGAGHVPIIKNCIKASPDFDVVSPTEYLESIQ